MESIPLKQTQTDVITKCSKSSTLAGENRGGLIFQQQTLTKGLLFTKDSEKLRVCPWSEPFKEGSERPSEAV